MKERSIDRIGSWVVYAAVCLSAGCIDVVTDGIKQGVNDAFAGVAEQLVTDILTAPSR